MTPYLSKREPLLTVVPLKQIGSALNRQEGAPGINRGQPHGQIVVKEPTYKVQVVQPLQAVTSGVIRKG